MGFLKKLFAGKEAQFRDRALALLQQMEPAARALAGAEDLLVELDGVQLDLHRLFEICKANETQAPELIRQYFSYPLSLRAKAEEPLVEVEARARPQLVPAEFATRFGILTFPFAADVVIGLMLRDGGYVKNGAPAEWNVSPADLLARSIRNLEADPVEMEVTITDGTDRFIGMEGRDGYDAARILLPRVREFAAQKLGAPFFAGIPNRDFLILWSRDCSLRFQDYAEEKIETDFSIQAFPLSRVRFEVDATGVRPA